ADGLDADLTGGSWLEVHGDAEQWPARDESGLWQCAHGRRWGTPRGSDGTAAREGACGRGGRACLARGRTIQWRTADKLAGWGGSPRECGVSDRAARTAFRGRRGGCPAASTGAGRSAL